MKARSVVGGAAANVAGRIWLIFINLAIVPVYLRLLGIEAYGLVGVLASFQALMSVMDVGLGPTLARALARKANDGDPRSPASMHDWVRTVCTIVALTSIGFAIVVPLASHWLAWTWFNVRSLDAGAVATAIALMGVVVSAQFFASLCANGVQALERQGLANLINSGATTLRAAATVIALGFVGKSLKVFFLAQAIITLSHAAVAFTTLRLVLPAADRSGRFDLKLLRGEWRFALGSTGISLVSIAVTQMDKVVVTRFFPLSEFGYYSVASSLAAATPLLVSPIAQACYPRFCALHARRDESTLHDFYRLASQWITVALAGPVAVVVVFASDVLLAWTGNPDVVRRALKIGVILTLGQFFSSATNAPYALYLAFGKTRLFLISNAILVALLIPAMALLVPRYGTAGAAFAWLGYSLTSLVIVTPLVHWGTFPTEAWRWPLRDVLLPTMGALVGALAIRLIPWPGHDTGRLSALLRVLCGFLAASAGALIVARQAGASVIRAATSRFIRPPPATLL